MPDKLVVVPTCWSKDEVPDVVCNFNFFFPTLKTIATIIIFSVFQACMDVALTSVWPLNEAALSGVELVSVVWFTSAPRSNNNLTIAKWPPREAIHSGVQHSIRSPSILTVPSCSRSTSYSSRRHWTMAVLPFLAAIIKGVAPSVRVLRRKFRLVTDSPSRTLFNSGTSPVRAASLTLKTGDTSTRCKRKKKTGF